MRSWVACWSGRIAKWMEFEVEVEVEVEEEEDWVICILLAVARQGVHVA